MKKKQITSSFIIGIFVIFGISLIIFGAIWFGNDRMSEESKKYVSYFDSSVDGLTVGTAVKYQGLTCGSIVDMRIAADGELIEVVMDINPNVKITEKIRSKAAMAGIAGGKFVLLYYPKNKKEIYMYPRITFKPEFPVIKSSPSEFEEITLASRNIINELTQVKYLEIAKRIYEMVDTVTILVRNANQLAQNENIYITLENLEKTTYSLNHILAKVDSLQLYRNLDKTSANLLTASAKINTISDNINNQIYEMKLPFFMANLTNKLDSTALTINNSVKSIQYQSINTINGISELIESLKATNSELRRSLSAFTEQPTHTLFSNPPKKEK